MPELRIAFLGDVVGAPGRRAVAHAWPKLRDLHGAQALIVNGENARNGSGCSPDNYRELRRSGADAVTLGDHAFKDRAILEALEDPRQPIARAANLSTSAPGKRTIEVELPPGIVAGPGGSPARVVVLTVLGRLYMPLMCNSPFEAIDREMEAIAGDGGPPAMVIVEVHAEATSEKQAVAWHCLERWTGRGAGGGAPAAQGGPRVVAVLGTHTHVQTADARVLDHALAAMTDAGMCGAHRSVIGRDVRATLNAMVRQGPGSLDVADGDNRACGAILRLDTAHRRAIGIEPVNIAAPE